MELGHVLDSIFYELLYINFLNFICIFLFLGIGKHRHFLWGVGGFKNHNPSIHPSSLFSEDQLFNGRIGSSGREQIPPFMSRPFSGIIVHQRGSK